MSDEERDAIEREMEQCAAEEAARAEAEAEAERAMSDEGKVVCSEYKKCSIAHECIWGTSYTGKEFRGVQCGLAEKGIANIVPVSGEEKGK
jgi:hypothetical protein